MAAPAHLQATARCHLLLQRRCQHINQLPSDTLMGAAGCWRLLVLFLLLQPLLLLLLLRVGQRLLLLLQLLTLLLCAGVAAARQNDLVCSVSCQLKQVPEELYCLQRARHSEGFKVST